MILVAIGSNLPGRFASPLAACAYALHRLAAVPGLAVTACSSFYRTTPIPASDQPDFINAVAACAGQISPEALLAALHGIEAEAGRVRGALNAARVLDLDLIDWHGMVRDAPPPVLPHPRAHLRRFVLLPLHDVAPAWRHPLSHETVTALLAALPPQGVTRIDPAG